MPWVFKDCDISAYDSNGKSASAMDLPLAVSAAAARLCTWLSTTSCFKGSSLTRLLSCALLPVPSLESNHFNLKFRIDDNLMLNSDSNAERRFIEKDAVDLHQSWDSELMSIRHILVTTPEWIG